MLMNGKSCLIPLFKNEMPGKKRTLGGFQSGQNQTRLYNSYELPKQDDSNEHQKLTLLWRKNEDHILIFSQSIPYISRIMRKPAFCIYEDADQLNYREADQHLCFRYTDRTIPLLPKCEISICGCTARFVSDLVGNPEDLFSHNGAHTCMYLFS